MLRSVCLLWLCSVLQLSCQADDWPHWMGPTNDGVWREAGIVPHMPPQLQTLWSVPIQGGYSGPAVAGELLVVMDFAKQAKVKQSDANAPAASNGPSGQERILCLNATTGEQVWSHSYDTQLNVSYPGGPRCTPTIDGDRVYTLGTMGELICFQLSDGEIEWQLDLPEIYETKPPMWGYASPILILDDMLFCTVGGPGSGVVAFDKHTGQEQWKSLTAQEIGYAPLVLAELADSPTLVVWYDVALEGLDPASGDSLWKYDFPKARPLRPVVSIVPPHVNENQIFITNYYHGSALVEIGPEGVTEIWSTEEDSKHEEDINSIMSTVILTDESYIGVAGNGELRCVDSKSAELVWRSYAALATKDEDPEVMPRGTNGFAAMFITPQAERYWLFTDQGDLILAELERAGYRELGRQKILETTATSRGRAYVWCPPAFASGKLFVRNEEELICVDLRDISYTQR